jgi:hypothetical protein
MPYASHRIVGVIELEPAPTLVESHTFRSRYSLAEQTAATVARRIGYEIADSAARPRVASESAVKVDSANLLTPCVA